jgi:hypothetical protein
MSTLLGPMRQIGYVVKVIERAMRYWTEVNASDDGSTSNVFLLTRSPTVANVTTTSPFRSRSELRRHAAGADPAAMRHAEHVARLHPVGP